MEINGEVNIEIDQYADVSIEIDTEQLAEELAINHDFVDDVRMEEYFRSSVEDMVQDEMAGVRLDVSDNTDAIDELREKIRELQPDNNYVRINDLREVIDAQIDLRLTRILSDVMKGIEQYRKGSDA